MRRLSQVTAVAAMAATGLVLAPTAAQAAGVPLKTKIADVHVRSAPHRGDGSKIVGTIAAAGTTVQVICFVNTSGKYWLKIESPAGYVAARNIDFPRSNGSKVPAGVPAC